MNEFINKDISMYSASSFLVRAIVNNNYCINSQKTVAKAKVNSYDIFLHGDKKNISDIKLGIRHGEAISNGANLTLRGNLPPNICTPTYLQILEKNLQKNLIWKLKF